MGFEFCSCDSCISGQVLGRIKDAVHAGSAQTVVLSGLPWTDMEFSIASADPAFMPLV
ncbi:hypothetical protein RMSM_00929 [Rhodopirellula maiorica SM1]|uniref:Uncharacterized protein n=1 Tax=Rhodopirellula maiorica SM1 TaxID=1265738 RepID=M5S3D1_9BACT|nr:hypothetical protein RMSM_00929 [Rhodopirellula maiorica SM1]